jgi:hypothetical protein
MAFTPYSTPIQYEYKPLNLAAFAVPLGKMQEQLDFTKATLSSTDFDLAHLPYGSDPERAKELIETARAKRDELAKNLMETKNYRQAAIKLNELNKTWKLDPEKNALESNYKLWQERDKEERERIDNGKANQITRDQYLQWRADEIKKYEAETEDKKTGAAFKASWEKPEGDYRTITGSTGRLADLEDELQELSFKAAQAVETDSFEGAMALIGIDPTTMDAHFKKTIVESRSKEKTANAVRNYLLTQPKYKAWAEEVAHYDHLDMQNSGKYGEYAGEIVGNALKDNEQSIKDREAYLKKVQGKKEEDPVYANLLERKDVLSNMKSTGEYDPKVVEKLYTAQHVAGVFNFDALGKLFETKKVGTEDVFRDIPTDNAGGGGGGDKNVFGEEAFFHPETYEKFTVGTLQTQMNNAQKGILPTLKKLNSYGKGNVRTAIFAGLSDAEKQKLNGDFGAQMARNRNLFTSYENSSNVQEFINKAKAKGINLSLGNASTLWKLWGQEGGTGRNQFATLLQQGRVQEEKYESAQSNLATLRQNIRESDEWKQNMNDLDKLTPRAETHVVAGGEVISNYKWTPASKKLFNTDSYTKEQLKSVGVNPAMAEKEGLLTFGQVARLKGYKNVADAVAKGYNFAGAYVDAESGITISKFNQNLENRISPNLNTQDMSFNLLNTPKVTKELSQMVTTTGELMQHNPAYKSSWSQVPGFENGKPQEGTKIVTDGVHKPVIQVGAGNKLLLKYYYEYVDENGNKQISGITVEPKLGTMGKKENWIDNLLISTTGDDAASKSTRAMLLTTKFDLVYGNNITHSTYKALPVKEGQSKQLESVSLTGTDQSLVFMKEYPKGAVEPIIKIYLKNAAGGKRALDVNGVPGGNGQIFSTSNPDEAKKFAASLLLDQEAVVE